jgi:hypothetical protein
MKLSYLIDRADTLFRNFLLKQWGAPDRIECRHCHYCFLPQQITVGHIIERRNFATRWKVKNTIPLCGVCNQLDGLSFHSCDLISNADYEELWTLSRDPNFRLTEDFIMNEIKPYE